MGGVITLNEPYETLVSSSLYHVSVIPFFFFLDCLVFAFCVLIMCNVESLLAIRKLWMEYLMSSKVCI